MASSASGPQGQRAGRFLGSLKDALAAASRDDTGAAEAHAKAEAQAQAQAGRAQPPVIAALPPPGAQGADPASPAAKPESDPAQKTTRKDALPSAAEAAREARGSFGPLADRHVEADAPPTTRVVRASAKAAESPARTQLVRGKAQVKRGTFDSDPVVGWLVVVGGPGIGQYRPVFEGNNTIGRGGSNRIPLDFGDDAISTDEQAYIRYDSAERSFLFVPNLAKTNVVSLNEKRPTGAVELAHMDVITMGRTQLVFVPFCGSEFDWSAITEPRD